METRDPVIGKHILDSLSIGMYNHPLMLIREYVQNSTDAIDEVIKDRIITSDKAEIDIRIDGLRKCLTISDNGSGVSYGKAWNILHDIGNSKKKYEESRGFRGIGRLGGLGYCKILRFKTKAFKDDNFSSSTWDCEKLRSLIKDDNDLDTQEILKGVVDFRCQKYEGDLDDHFFEVKMFDLHSSRDILFNVPLVKAYLSEIAPVPFNYKGFRFVEKVEHEIRKRVPNYQTYSIYVNGEKIYKPYIDAIYLRGDKKDRIQDIDFIELSNGVGPLAFGWIARTGLLGTIAPFSHMDGLRVRKDNILIGNKDLLSEFYRETRFNNYLVGEIHTIDTKLIPNSRRDDFEDNQQRDELYDSFIKSIGLPFSKRIRNISLERSKQRAIDNDKETINCAKRICQMGYFSEYQRKKIVQGLRDIIKRNRLESEAADLLEEVNKAPHYLDKTGKLMRKRKKRELGFILDVIYKKATNKKDAEKTIMEILDNLHISGYIR
jgi:molecular chaperone HtpG